MTITLTIGPGLQLSLEPAIAERLHKDLGAALAGVDAAGSLPDEHPLWKRHSGGDGHKGPEWSVDDLELAEAFYAKVKGKAKVGRQVSTDDILAVAPETFSSSFSIAGAINGLRLPHKASSRRYPFYWWEGNPTRYAVKPTVAALFNQARARSAA
jgi:hypothetical protein